MEEQDQREMSAVGEMAGVGDAMSGCCIDTLRVSSATSTALQRTSLMSSIH